MVSRSVSIIQWEERERKYDDEEEQGGEEGEEEEYYEWVVCGHKWREGGGAGRIEGERKEKGKEEVKKEGRRRTPGISGDY